MMITFSKNVVNRRDPSDEPSPEPFYIIYDSGHDIGELHADIAAGTAEALIMWEAPVDEVIKRAVHKHFPEITTTKVHRK